MNRPLHKESKFFIKKGLFNKVYSFRALEKRIEKLKAKNIKAENLLRGNAFEVFVEAFLNTSDSFEAVKVYPSLAQTPAIIRQKLGVGKKDKGIDGVFLTKDETIVPYQAKFKTGRGTVDYGQITKFLEQSKKAVIRYLIGNSKDVNEEYKEDKKRNLSVKGYDFDNLSKEQFQTAINWLKQKPPVFKPTKPDPKYQTKIIADTCKELRKADRATMVMACASGKTLVSMWIAQNIAPKTIVIFVPSLALIKQFQEEWIREKPFKNVLKKVICSKLGEENDYDDEKLTQDDVSFPIDTDPLDVRRFLNRKFNGTKIIFCTYQSSRVLKEAMQKKHAIDLGVFDEAHRTTQYKKITRKKNNKKPEVNWSLGLFDEHIKINKRLFMTATVSEITKNEFLKDGDDKIVYVMNDKTLYGEQVCNFTFAQAREVGAICPYKVLISVITKKDLSVYTIKNSNVLIDGKEISAEQFALQLAVKAAVKKFKTKKIFTFHHRCSSANSFVKKENPEGIQRHLKDFYTGYVDGAMSMSNRTDIMSLFKDHEKSLVSNARCLVEGVNVPAVDMVVFVDPKKSKTDIAQAAGRAMRIRNLPNKKMGYILIPLFIESFRGEKVKEASGRTGFDEVFSTLRGLSQFDDDIRDEMTLLKVNQLRGKGRNKIGGKLTTLDGKSKDRTIDIIGDSKALELAIEAKILNDYKKNDTWEGNLAMLIDWKEKYKNFEIPLETKRPFLGLGEWVHGVRLRQRNDSLNELRVKQLNSIGFRWSFDGETLDNVDGLLVEAQFMKESKLSHLIEYRKQGLIKPVGRAYIRNVLSYFYKSSQIAEIKKKLGVTLKSTKGLLSEQEFMKYSGFAGIGNYRRKGLIKPVGKALYLNGVTNFYKPSQAAELNKKFGITLKSKKGLLSEAQFKKQSGFTQIYDYRKQGLIKPVGTAMTSGHYSGGVSFFYHPRQIKELKKELGITLESKKGLLNEDAFYKQSKLKNIAKYRKQGLIKPVGKALSFGGVRYYYKPSQIAVLKKKLGITLTSTKGLLSEQEFAKKIGVNRITQYRKQGLIKPVGKAMRSSHVCCFYKLSQIPELKKKLGITLASTKGLVSEPDFKKQSGLPQIAKYRKQGLIKPVGEAFSTTKISYFYKPSQIAVLKKKLGITLTSTKGLLSEPDFKKQSGFNRVSEYLKQGLIKPVGKALYLSKLTNYYKPPQAAELSKKLGINLKSTKGLLVEKEFMKKSGFSNIAEYRKQGLIKPVGKGKSATNLSYFYKPSQIAELKKKLGITLKSTKGLLNEKEFKKHSGFSNIAEYRKQGLIKPICRAFASNKISYFYKPSQAVELKRKLKNK